jgi:transcriptional regulator
VFRVDSLQPFWYNIAMAPRKVDLLQGTLDMLILRTLQWGAQHGQGIAQMIRANSGDVLQIETGSLYPALHRLEAKRWIAAEWKLSAKNQRARYYRLTRLGKKQLTMEESQWRLLVKAISKVLKPA